MLPRDRQFCLADKSVELIEAAGALRGMLQPELREELGKLVRSLDCHYSNGIEGVWIDPVDIESAGSGTWKVPLEAVAHVAVQGKIDRSEAPSPCGSGEFARWVHRELCGRLPEDLLWMENPDSGKRTKVIPGEFREHEVVVGRHLAPPAQDLEGLMKRFEAAYGRVNVPPPYRCVSVAAAHHRFLWIHPFGDGNGRVARLMSHGMLKEWSIGSELWSVSRGLARNVEEYKRRLGDADSPRRGDYDGRGALSEEGLARFCEFFLDVCIDQVRFMQSMLRPEGLLARVRIWCDEEVAVGRLHKEAWKLLREAILAGSFARGRAGEITGYQERRGRAVLNELVERGVLVSDGPKGAVRLGFPVEVVERWIPTLYPAKVGVSVGA